MPNPFDHIDDCDGPTCDDPGVFLILDGKHKGKHFCERCLEKYVYLVGYQGDYVETPLPENVLEFKKK